MSKLFESLRWRIKTARHRVAGTRQQRVAAPAPAGITGEEHLDRQLVNRLAKPKPISVGHFRHIGKVLTPRERIWTRILGTIALVALAFIGFRAVVAHLDAIPLPKGSYTEGLVGAPQFINPLLSQTNDVDADISSLIFSGLFRYDENLHTIPDLAEKYSVSDDGLTYTVTLRDNLRWHDGTNISADDIVFTFSSAQDPEFHSPLYLSLLGIQVSKTGEREVTFRLPEPHDRFLELLTTGLLPEHLWGEIPPIHSTLNEYNLNNPIGSGRWRFKSLTKDGRGNIKTYSLVPFSDAVGAKPYLQEITFKFYSDPGSAVAALNNRTVDGIGYLPNELEAEVNDPQIKRYALTLPRYTAIFFNQQANPALREKSVRQALTAAIDRAKILSDVLELKGEIVEGPILPNTPGFDPTIQEPAYDPAAAEKLLDDAGWSRIDAAAYAQLKSSPTTTATSTTALHGATATSSQPIAANAPAYYRRNTAGAILELNLTTVDSPENAKGAELVAQFWRGIGVDVNVTIVSKNRILREIIKPRSYQAILYGEVIGADPDPYPFWHSSQVADPGLNLAIFSNRQVDKLLEEARATQDGNVKAKKFQEFARLVNAELPAIFLYAPTYTYAMRASVKGFAMTKIMLPQDRFNQIFAWYVKTGFQWR